MQLEFEGLIPTATNIFMLLVSIAATWVVTKWYYRKGVRIKGLSWAAEIDWLVNSRSGALSEIKLSYKGIKLQRPRFEKVYIWNSGNQTISMDDVSEADPLRLLYKDAKVIDVCDCRSNRGSVSPKAIKLNRNEINVAFDYLDPGDGICLSVLADTNKKVWGSAGEICGSIRGCSHGIVHEQYYDVAYPRSWGGLAVGLAFSSAFLIATILLCVDLYSIFAWTAFDAAKMLAVIVTGFLAIAIFGMTFENQFKRNRLPNALLRQSTDEPLLRQVGSDGAPA